MAIRPASATGRSPSGHATGDPRWASLRALVGARLLVAALSLPIGVLWWPGAGPESRWVLTVGMLAVGAASGGLWLWARWGRAHGVAVTAHVLTDLLIVTGLAAATGARGSQFTLFYVLVVITGGVQAGLRGGLAAAAGACALYAGLPWISRWIGIPGGFVGSSVTNPVLLPALLAVVGALAGVLGVRNGRVRADLEAASRELERVRFDHDAILRHLTSGVMTLDSAGRVSYLNPAAEEMLGLRGEDLIGRPAREACPERLAGLRDALLDALDHGRVRLRGEVSLRSSSGRAFPIGLSTKRLTHDDGVTGVVSVFQDLSEIREMERVARRNQTLAEVGALAAGIAHELRNGLKPISGSVEVLQRELSLEGENAQLMELVGRESHRLNRFVTDLLSYARERDVAREAIPVDEHLRELVEGLRHDPRCAPGVTLRAEVGEAVGVVLHADREQLRQVWLNLAANAFEAVGPRGTLVVRAIPGADGRLTVEFEDDGPGIAAEDLPRVGEPFFTTKHGGTGLGLAIATRIVERHGGTLSLDSAPGRGTRVRVTLPDAQPAMAAAA